MNGVRLPEGPSLPVLAQTLAFGLMPARFLDWCAEKYGETFTLRLPSGRTLVMFSHPQAIKEIFTASPDDLHAGESSAPILEPFVGTNSLLLLDGKRHLSERRLMMPSFHGERMRTYVQLMVDVTRDDMATWPRGEPFAMRAHTQAITLAVILRAVFGVDDDDALAELHRQMHRILTASVNPQLMLPLFRYDLGPRSPWGRFLRQREEVDAALLGEIRRRRVDPRLAEREDILSMLIQSRYEDGSGLNDMDLRDELITLLLAGHETTATALAWAFDLLLHNPRVMRRLEATLAEGDEAYLDAVVKEVLRIRPVVPQVGRKLQRPMTIGGHDLPAGVLAVPNIVLAHRRPDVYPEPHAFRPERFLEQQVDTYTWIPFGGGTRRCLGAAFATTEMKVVLKTVLAEARLRPADPDPEPVTRRLVTLVPRHGTMVVREEAAAA